MDRFSITLSGEQINEVNEAATDAGMEIPAWLEHIIQSTLRNRKHGEVGFITHELKEKLADASRAISSLLQIEAHQNLSDLLPKSEVMKRLWPDAKLRPSIPTWDRWQSNGIIPCHLIDGEPHYHETDVRRALEDQFRATNFEKTEAST